MASPLTQPDVSNKPSAPGAVPLSWSSVGDPQLLNVLSPMLLPLYWKANMLSQQNSPSEGSYLLRWCDVGKEMNSAKTWGGMGRAPLSMSSLSYFLLFLPFPILSLLKSTPEAYCLHKSCLILGIHL